MGLFGGKFEMTDAQTKKLNSLLPKNLQQEFFEKRHFKGEYKIINQHRAYREQLAKTIDKLNDEIKEIKSSLLKEKSFKIKIFNCSIEKTKPLGMVDVGAIHQFSGSSTGERFAGGLIGYALEMAIDDVWKKSTKQEEAVNETKLKLLMKAISLYPTCNVITNFDVDFREMGSSGNVFIYMRGTACEGENDLVKKIEKEITQQIKEKEKIIEQTQKQLESAKQNALQIPETIEQIEEKLK